MMQVSCQYCLNIASVAFVFDCFDERLQTSVYPVRVLLVHSTVLYPYVRAHGQFLIFNLNVDSQCAAIVCCLTVSLFRAVNYGCELFFAK
jgi:hypothetical protein